MAPSPIASAAGSVGSLFSGLIGGQFGSLLKLLPIKNKALKATEHALEAVDSGLKVISLVIGAIKSVISMIVEGFKTVFNAIAELFTGFKQSVVELVTSEDTENAEEKDNASIAAGLALTGIAGSLAYINRDSIKSEANEVLNNALGQAPVIVEEVKSIAKQGFTLLYDAFMNSDEVNTFNKHTEEAVQGFNEVSKTLKGFDKETFKNIVSTGLKYI
jgi:phage-related protein